MGAAVLLDGEEVDSQDKLCCEEHLDEDTLSDARPVTESVCDKKRSGEGSECDACSGRGSDKLCSDDSSGLERWHGSDEDQTKSHLQKEKE